MSKEETEEEVPQEPVQIFNWKRFGYMFLGILTLMVFIDSELRGSLGNLIGDPLFALVGFDGQYPLLTLVISGTIMIVFSTIVRDFLVDWVEMAEIQKKTSAFNKEHMDAKMANKTTKLKKLDKLQPEVSSMQMKSMKPQFKSMILTTIVFITIFAALWTFLGDLPNVTYAIPWAFNANFTNNLGPIPFPQWIAVYMIISAPIGQAFRMALQMFSYSRRINEMEETGLG
ncbi:MAG: EMC3/TMCO1 family protein [Thermoplasmata archaeon]